MGAILRHVEVLETKQPKLLGLRGLVGERSRFAAVLLLTRVARVPSAIPVVREIGVNAWHGELFEIRFA